MTKSELKALEKAFGIPEPEKKNEFIEAFNEKYTNTYKYNKQDRKKRILPIIMGYASTAAIAVLVIGAWINLKDTGDIRKKPDLPIVTITTFDRTQTDITTVNDSVTGTIEFSEGESSSKSEKSNETKTKSTTSKTTETKAKNQDKSGKGLDIVTADPNSNTETTVYNDVTASTRRTTAARTTSGAAETSTSLRTTTTTRTSSTATRRTTTASRTGTTKKMTTTRATATATGTHYMTTTTRTGTGVPRTTTEMEWTTLTMGTWTTAATYTQYVPIAETTTYSGSRDLTVMPDVVYYPDDDMKVVETTASGWSWRPPSTPTQADVWYTDNVVEATVVDKIYTVYNYDVFTQYNIRIDKIFKSDGSYKEGDTISVYVEGGVLPSELFKRYYDYSSDIPDGEMVKFLNGNKAELDVDDDYLFILLGDALFVPNGAYAIADKSATSIFKYNGYDYVSLEYYNIYAYP